jgi:hypothetical protein
MAATSSGCGPMCRRANVSSGAKGFPKGVFSGVEGVSGKEGVGKVAATGAVRASSIVHPKISAPQIKRDHAVILMRRKCGKSPALLIITAFCLMRERINFILQVFLTNDRSNYFRKSLTASHKQF